MLVDYISLISSVMLTCQNLADSILATPFANPSNTTIKSIILLANDRNNFLSNKEIYLPNQKSVIHGDKVKDAERLSKFILEVSQKTNKKILLRTYC